MITEADTCRKYVVPALQAAGWDADPHAIHEQRTFTDGRIVVAGGTVRRLPFAQGSSVAGGASLVDLAPAES